MTTISNKERDVGTARGGLSGGTIAGIVVGCVTAILLCIACTWFFVLKPRRRRRQTTALDEPDEKIARDALHSAPELTGTSVHELPAKHGHHELGEVKMVPELGNEELVHELPSEGGR